MTHQVFINEIVKANFNLRQPKSRQGDENEIYLNEEEISKIYSLKLPYKEGVARDVFILNIGISRNKKRI